MTGHRFAGGLPDQSAVISSAAARRVPSGRSMPNQVAVASCLWPQRKAYEPRHSSGSPRTARL